MSTHSEYLETSREKLLENGFLSEESLNFYLSLLRSQEKFLTQLAPHKKNVSIKKNVFPLMDPSELEITDDEIAVFSSSLKEIVSLVDNGRGGLDQQKILDFFGKKKNILKSIEMLLAHRIEELKKTGLEINFGFDEFVFILVNLIKPYIFNLRLNSEIPDLSEWDNPHCPFCGYFADMVKIVESGDNRRMLHCGLCGTEWQYARLKCPVCGNDDHEKLEFFSAEGDNLYRIDHCSSCNGYIKTIRISRGKEETEFDLDVENIITGFLDAAAIEMGFIRP